jgi:16S rRNA (guanine527-N7)-methyltransferase
VEIIELLKKGLAELGLAPSGEQIHAFMTYLSELKKWSRAYNLTGIKKDEDIIIKHFLDSLLYLKAIPAGEMRVADIGSGAGFPGIPLKIIRPDMEMYLIEPSGKKSAFLRHIIRHLKLRNIEVIEERIEDVRVNKKISSPVDIAVTRALCDSREFINKASHIVRQGGTLVLSKGPKVKEEINTLTDVTYDLLIVSLPLSEIKRHLVVVTLNDWS